MAEQKKTSPLVGLVGLAGLVGIGWYFWPKKAYASPPVPALTIHEPDLYVPPVADTTGAIVEEYQLKSGDWLSKITRNRWQADADARSDAAGIARYDAAQLWLLLWSANYSSEPDPNAVEIGETVHIPPLSVFSDDSIANARAHYLDWRDYSP